MSPDRPLKAIQTRLYGHLFRSRLEARWAVFLTEAGFLWEYEPEGFELDAGRYLPDFRVTRNGVTIWLEIKPMIEDYAADPRHAELARRDGRLVFVAQGLHRPGDRCEQAHSARVFHPDGQVYAVHRLWQDGVYDVAWRRANTARFDGTDAPGFFTRPTRRGRRR